jgi:DNA-binding transcriptional ArsR family regulator
MMPEPYDPAHRLLEMSPEQAAAFSDPTRNEIVALLAERPASTTQLAEALGKPKGTVGHHLKALEQLGLIRVVRTRKVRALTEKYYGRVAVTYVFPHLGGDEGKGRATDFIMESLAEMRPPRDDEADIFTIRRARIDSDRAADWERRLLDLAEEFATQPRSGTTAYGLIIGLYPTDRPALPPDIEGEE